MSLNYYEYVDNNGKVWSKKMSPTTAAFVGASPSATRNPLVATAPRTRKLRLADPLTGQERLIVAPVAWPYNLNDFVTYEGVNYYVTFLYDEAVALERG